MKNFYFIIGVVFLLASCTSERDLSTSEGSYHRNRDIGYEIFIPSKLNFKALGDSGFFYNSWNVNNEASPTDYSVDIYEFEESTKCANTGVNKRVYKETNTFTGRVDAIPWDHDPPPQPSCMIGMPGIGGSPYTASYMLCSEKDGKQVAICVMQVTDDPDLANQIFDTFRWLD